MTSTFKLSRAAMWAGLITASLGLNAWAGRPLDVDDAGVNAKGHGHVELWQTRAGDGSRNWTIAPAFAPIDGFEVAYVRNTDNSSQDVAQTLQLKGLITPSKEDGCNQAATYGITRRNHALAGARYGWLINTCNQSWGSWHTNLGASHDFSTASKPLLAMALAGAVWFHDALTFDALRDHRIAYVAVETDSLLVAIDMQNLSVKGTLSVGARTNGLTMHPNGKWLFASNGGDANVAVINTQSFSVHTKVPVGQRPWNMAITPDGSKLYVAAGRSHAVSVIDTNTFTATNSISVGKLPWGAAAN